MTEIFGHFKKDFTKISHLVLLEDTEAVQLHTAVEGRLASEGQEDPVGSLGLNDLEMGTKLN